MSVSEDAEVRQLTNEEYHADRAHDSNSSLKLFRESPARYYHIRVTGRIKPKPTTEPQRLGWATHSILLEREKLESLIAVIPETALTKDGKRFGKAWEEWLANESRGRLPVKLAEYDGLCWRVESAWGTPAVAKLLQSFTAREQSVFWHQGTHPCKARFDGVDEFGAVLGDIKNTSQSEGTFWRAVKDYGYHCQAAIYSDGFKALHDVTPDYQLIVMDDEPPYECRVRRLPVDAVKLGRQVNAQTMAEIQECRAGKRPWRRADSDEIGEVQLPVFFYPADHNTYSEML